MRTGMKLRAPISCAFRFVLREENNIFIRYTCKYTQYIYMQSAREIKIKDYVKFVTGRIASLDVLRSTCHGIQNGIQ